MLMTMTHSGNTRRQQPQMSGTQQMNQRKRITQKRYPARHDAGIGCNAGQLCH